MAETRIEHHQAVHTEDLFPVRSRISWGAVASGSVLALSLYFLLTLLGGAIGLSIGDRVDGHNLATGAAIYAIAITIIALFVGGYIASQMTVGENKSEAALYGVMVWALTFAMLMWLMASGVKAGFNAMMGVATAGRVVAQNTNREDFESTLRNAGFSQDRINALQAEANAAAANAGQQAQDPANRQAAAEAATRVTWYTLLGAALSMAAAALGGYVGAGPTLRLFDVSVNRTSVSRTGPAFGA